MPRAPKISSFLSHRSTGFGLPGHGVRIASVWLIAFLSVFTCSCSLTTLSPYVVRETTIPVLTEDAALICSQDGQVPYQKWRVPPWDEEMRYVWIAGHYNFKRFRDVELVLYFHGMHSKDYYRTFQKELREAAQKRPHRPFLFVGFVDTPYVVPESRSRNRWKYLIPAEGEPPERLFQTVNRIFKSFQRRFPHVRKERATITLAGFSGGGRVLDSVGNWLAQSEKDDPFATVFRARLRKLVYFDCWFDRDILKTVPALLESNPAMKIVSTVHMDTPTRHARMLAEKLKMKKRHRKDELVGVGGRVTIYRDSSHWNAMISRLKEAL